MISKIKKPVSILLVFMMIVSLFAIVPVTASAEVGDFVPESEYLTFTAEEAGSSVTLKVSAGSNLQYNKNNSGWQDYTKGAQIDLASVDDSVRFRGKDTTFSIDKYISIGGKVACSGNVMSLRLDDNGMSQGLSDGCFSDMFKGCTGLTAAPELPETTLAVRCYERMFCDCTNLTVAPELPATTLAGYCYSNMFYRCTSLTTAPELWATTLVPYCYRSMFYGCTSLTTAPELPATSLAASCYNGMFYGCTSLTTAPELPATMLESNCYSNMFNGCERLTKAPELPATTLAPYCYSSMFYGCTSLTTAPELLATMLAQSCYSNMFSGCGRLTAAPELPATSLADSCYSSMFYGCTSLTTAPELPATELTSYCYRSMFEGCSSIKLSETQTAEYSIPYSVPSGGDGTTASNALRNMFYGTGGTFKGTPEINKTYYRPAKKYTVTWKNGDDVIKTDTVDEGTTPAYDGETPEKADDENYTYTFAGWTPEITAVTGDITYTATYTETAKPKDIFPQHSITLGGNIGVNFYIDSAAADFANASTAVVKFTWDGGSEENSKEINLKELTPDADGYYKATVDVVAAHMAHEIHAEVYLDGEKLNQTDDYSVKEYAETVYANPAEYDSEKPDELKALAKALLNYGAMAQTVFDSALTEHPALANTVVGDNGYEGVTADQIEGAINDEASDLNEVATQLGAKYYTNSLIYLSKNTLRIYFTPTSYPGEIPNAGAYDGNLSGYYYYVEKVDIPAAELDNQQTFNVNGTEFTFSALDYAKAVVESTKMEPEQQNLAKSLFLYNQKANAYFDAAPAPVENEVISSGFIDDFSTLNVGDYIAKGVEYAADIDYKVVLTGGTYGTESPDGIVVRNGDYNFNAGEYSMGTYFAHVPQSNICIEDYNENEKFYPAVDGVEGNAFVVVAKDDTQKIITIAGANVTQN